MQEAVLLDRTATTLALLLSILAVTIVRGGRRGKVWDLLGNRVLATNRGDTDI